MSSITNWFHAHKTSTHGIAAAIGTFAVIVETDSHIREMLTKDFDLHPKLIPGLCALGAIILAYKNSKKSEK